MSLGVGIDVGVSVGARVAVVAGSGVSDGNDVAVTVGTVVCDLQDVRRKIVAMRRGFSFMRARCEKSFLTMSS